MTRCALILLACLIAHNAYAQETQQRIRDLSLSPLDSLRQPTISHSQNYNNSASPYASPGGDTSNDSSAPDNGYAAGTASARFMDGYCDPNFKPLLANSPGLAGLETCLQTQRQQTCQQFQSLPVDAQDALDNVIGCLYAADNNDAPDGGQPAADPGCESGDSQRMRLLKKYWRDPAIAQALVFLPDGIMNASARCMRGEQ